MTKGYRKSCGAAEKFKNPNAKKTDPKKFLRLLNGMTFGNSEDQGILRGNDFYHKSLDLRIAFPDSWKVDNQPTQLVAISPKQSAAMIIQLRKPGNAQTPRQFLNNNFKNLRNGEPLNGDGYTAITQGKTPFGNGPVRVAALFHGEDVLVVSGFAKGGLPDRAYFDTVDSIRGLRGSERKLATAKRIKTIKVKQGDTIASLARRSNLERYAEAQIRLLNGLYPDGEPIPGQLIKIIK